MGVIMKNKVNYTGGGGSGGASALVDLEDVELTTPTDGQALVYDETNNAWINGNVSGGGNTLVIQDASIYSTDEQQVGVWTDGRPIYKKTWIFDTWITVNQNSIFSLASKGVSISNLGVITSSEAIMTLDKRSMFPVAVGMRSGDISIFNYSGLAVDIDGITLYYTKTTDAAGSGGYKAYGLSPIIYSEEEREVGVWTDGKPLYQKTVHFSNVSASGSVSFNVANVETVFLADAGNLYDSASLPYVHGAVPSVSVGGFFNKSANDLTWEFRSGSSATTPLYGFITARYTKTTDQAGSGVWTTTGEYTHHYSTDEKVVGTWTDGKPLYEKVFTGLSVALNGISWVNLVTIQDAEFCLSVNAYRTQNPSYSKIPIAECDVNNGNIRVSTVSSQFNMTINMAIVQYTKTTD